MKRFLLFFLLSIISFLLVSVILLKIYEKEIIEQFKIQIIDKTNINFTTTDTKVSIIKSFPLCAIELDDVCVYYSDPKVADTLMYSQKVRFKINIINLYKSIYEFPEIEISNGNLKLIKNKLEFDNNKNDSTSSETLYRIKTNKIRIKKFRVDYIVDRKNRYHLNLQHATFSGSFQPNALILDFEAKTANSSMLQNRSIYRIANPILLTGTLKQNKNQLFCENGRINYKRIALDFAFYYDDNSENVSINSKSSWLNISDLSDFDRGILSSNLSKGKLRLNVTYKSNLKNSKAEKLTLAYDLTDSKTAVSKIDINFSLSGTTTFSNSYKSQNTSISKFCVSFNGLEINGNGRIKGIDKPILLIDSKISTPKNEFAFYSSDYKGSIKGDLKLLLQIDSVSNLILDNIKLIDKNITLSVNNLYDLGNQTLKNLTGTATIENNDLVFKGKGKLFNSTFRTELFVPEILNNLSINESLSPEVSISFDQLNYDSIANISIDKSSKPSNIRINFDGFAKRVIYKDVVFTNARLNGIYCNGIVDAPKASLDLFDGSLSGSFKLIEGKEFQSSLAFQKVDVHKLFRTFNNFDQSVVTYQNIDGKISGKTDLSMQFDRKGDVDFQSIKLSSDLIVENGKFYDLKQFESMSKYLNLKELESINFKTLENHISIQKGVVSIPSMRINSNALNLTLAGEHKFDGEFVYWIKASLKEILAKKFLSKNKQSADFENDDSKGLNIYIKFFGNYDKYQFVFDRKGATANFKNALKQEGSNLKSILQSEFNIARKDSSRLADSLRLPRKNKIDTLHNKNANKPFKIEWDEIDTTKVK